MAHVYLVQYLSLKQRHNARKQNMSVCYVRLSYNLSESFEQTLHPTQEFSRWALDIT